MKQIVGFNLANDINEVIAHDLHELGSGFWFLHMIDLFSMVVIIHSKEAGVIVELG